MSNPNQTPAPQIDPALQLLIVEAALAQPQTLQAELGFIVIQAASEGLELANKRLAA